MLLGPPASGKGTLAEQLNQEFGLGVVSPGSLLRAEKANGSELGRRADELTSQGRLVDDDTVNAIVGKWLDTQTDDGFVFDGYPRTVGQAEALNVMMERRGIPLQLALLLEATEDTLRKRVQSRATCGKCGTIVSIGLHVASIGASCPRCGGHLMRRSDDTLETLTTRLSQYREKTEPLVQFYEDQGILQRVSTEQPPQTVFNEVSRLVA